MYEYTVKNNDFSEYDNNKDLTLERIDRNNTHYYIDTKCPKCGGTGYIPGYEHVEGGVCFLCGGTGHHSTKIIVRTEEYANKLAEARLARARKGAAERNAELLAKEGFSVDGEAWLVMGNTYEIKEQLKAAGAKWHNLFGWHFNHPVEQFPTVKISINDEMTFEEFDMELGEDKTVTRTLYFYNYQGTLTLEGNYVAVENYIRSIREAWEAEHAPKTEYLGNIGDRITAEVKCTRIGGYETMYGYTTVFTFEDDQNHMFVWKTGSYTEIEKGDQLKLKGTIKAHSEYKGSKQTELTRCKVI